jgi:hypothetical protein
LKIRRFQNKYKFYQDTGITRGILDQNNGMSEENTANFLTYYPYVSAEWLLTGYDPMIKEEDSEPVSGIGIANTSQYKVTPDTNGAMPLIPVAAMAGPIGQRIYG